MAQCGHQTASTVRLSNYSDTRRVTMDKKGIFGCATIVMSQFVFPQGVVADYDIAEQSALDAQSARLQATIDADIDTLEKYLANDSSYSHTTALILDRF